MVPLLILILLSVFCFGAAGPLESWHAGWNGAAENSASALAILFGDSQRLLADQLFHKADVYFHSGYYPSIFDAQPKESTSRHLEGASAHSHDSDSDEPDFLGASKDWVDAFGRHFFPAHHRHLDESGQVQEILPWLEFSAALNPHREETYVVAGFWLRTRLGNLNEAEKFLRRGWQENPDSYLILLELGKFYQDGRHDRARARNVWELALQKWKHIATPESDRFPYMQLLAHLAALEEQSGNDAKAAGYLKMLEIVSPNSRALEQQIKALEARAAAAAPRRR